MRSSQAVLHLCGGLASALVILLALGIFLVDVLGSLADGLLFRFLHYLAITAVLGACGVAGIFVEVKPMEPHPLITETAPYLGRLNGRAAFYFLLGMYTIGRNHEGGFVTWLNRLIGMYLLGVGGACAVFARQNADPSSFPAAMSEPALSREMPLHSAGGGGGYQDLAAAPPAPA
eukprot:TRINITY_DN92232_c0_g1_i1.p1 TRINITY_DN92232_c0_g1~~TRINITY_DN92232_c0_g1_i1.p1  ORF type:complete len:175 (+),score=18.29 TRINITY_DN92232_c0_g1_i1:137-661(+)